MENQNGEPIEKREGEEVYRLEIRKHFNFRVSLRERGTRMRGSVVYLREIHRLPNIIGISEGLDAVIDNDKQSIPLIESVSFPVTDKNYNGSRWDIIYPIVGDDKILGFSPSLELYCPQ